MDKIKQFNAITEEKHKEIEEICLVSAIYAVYDKMADAFDDDKLYLISAYFLMRAVMRMHSHDV